MLKKQNINTKFLNTIIKNQNTDHYYHYGITSENPIIQPLKHTKNIILAGTPQRTKQLATTWSQKNGNTPILQLPKTERFTTYYTNQTIFTSHGMGMPSASIAIQELMRLMYHLKQGNLQKLDQIFWARIGTSGGIGVPPGTVIITTEGLMSDLLPYRTLDANGNNRWYNGKYPKKTIQKILTANQNATWNIQAGKTISANEFYTEQYRLDGAITFETNKTKNKWLKKAHKHGARNIEMEAAMIGAYLNHWGFSKYATICCTLLDRRDGDQVTATEKQLNQYSQNTLKTLFNYLEAQKNEK